MWLNIESNNCNPKNPNPSLEWYFSGSNPILRISQETCWILRIDGKENDALEVQ